MRPLRSSIADRVRGTALEGPLHQAVVRLERGGTRRHRVEHQQLRRLFAWTLRPSDACIDVGANRGIVLAEFVRFAPHGAHIAFEPVPDLHEDLARRFPTVDVRALAVTGGAGRAQFTHFPTQPGFSRLGLSGPIDGHHGQMLDVETVGLDDALPKDFAPRILKIDAEGADRSVIEGAIQTIRTHRPLVVFEHTSAGNAGDDNESAPIIELLCGRAGMRIFDLDGGGPYDLAMLRGAHAAGHYFNFVAQG
jgi:FkbM family methyltransferase